MHMLAEVVRRERALPKRIEFQGEPTRRAFEVCRKRRMR